MYIDPDHIPTTPIPKRIETERLILKKMSTNYAEEYYFLEKEGMEQHMAPFSPEKKQFENDSDGIRDAKEAILLTEEKWDAGADYRFLIVSKEDMKVIGKIGITNVIRGVSQSAFVGYWVGFPYINKGYATEACKAIFDFAFGTLRLHRLSIWVSVGNEPSLRVAEKLKLRYEGTALGALKLGGKWHDTKVFAVTAEEWTPGEAKSEKLKA